MTPRTAVLDTNTNTSFSSAQLTHSPKLPGECTILDRFLVMAQAYRAEGNVFNAMELFWKLVEDYPDSPQAEESKNALIEIAMQYEHEGLRHPAYAIYERLL